MAINVNDVKVMQSNASQYAEKVKKFTEDVKNVMDKINEIDSSLETMVSKIDASWDTEGAKVRISALKSCKTNIGSTVNELKDVVDSVSNSKIEISY